MIKNGKYGCNTQTGLKFEADVDLATFLSKEAGYTIYEWNEIIKKSKSKAYKVFYKNEEIAQIFKKNSIYTYLETFDINWKDSVSKKLLPDDSIFVIKNNTIYIIEVKCQNVAGSVDEKLQTCDFKKKQWQKILAKLNCQVEYWYLLSDWFDKKEYKDTLDYIINSNCKYFFKYIPLVEMGLPYLEKIN